MVHTFSSALALAADLPLDAGLAFVADLGFAEAGLVEADFFVVVPVVAALALVFEAGFLVSPVTA